MKGRRRKGSAAAGRSTAAGRSAPAPARSLAVEALVRIDEEGAYANLLVPRMLDRSDLEPRDRALVTELVYGTTRMRRACDWLVDRFLVDDRVEPLVRAALRLGAYELTFRGSPPHAAVSEAVSVAPRRARGLVNAVLRRVAAAPVDPGDPAQWPAEAVRLSVPDWILDRLAADHGHDAAVQALEVMNRPAPVTERADGYVQDPASQLVVEALDAQPGELVLDSCAAPGGKATGAAAAGATVVAGDLRPGRVGLVRANVDRLGARAVLPLVADGTRPPFPPDTFHRVLVDAPCSGLGTLRRRPDARWRVDPGAPARLAALQLELCHAAAAALRPGGRLVYSACTLTRAEGPEVDRELRRRWPRLVPVEPGPPWRPWEGGGLLLPQDEGTDGMLLFVYEKRVDPPA